MESVLRGLIVYAFLFIVFRLSGKRTLGETTTFDLILLLIISETTQQAMIDGDNSLTNCFVLVITLISASVLLSIVKERFPSIERWMEGVPIVIVEDGRCLEDRMSKMRIDEEDVLEAARKDHGIRDLAGIRYAVVEKNGSISIIPRDR